MQQRVTFEVDYAPEEMSVEKDAKIFEIGTYPDKEITITEIDLDTIIGNFTEVPVKVEHTDSPLDPLGTVKRIWRKGSELFARLAFPGDMAAFLERRGVKKLSVALHRDPLRLAEVSLVLSPRVPTAAMFGKSSDTTQSRSEVSESMSNTHESERDRDIAELRFALRVKDVDIRLADLKARGKIVPASEAYAREILLKGEEQITFNDGQTTIARLFEQFMEAQPEVMAFGELSLAVASEEASSPLSAEEEEMIAKLGVTREQIRRHAV